MGKEVYDQVMDCANSILEDKPAKVNYKAIVSQDSSKINLTLKNYHSRKGVATQLHNAQFDE